MSSNKGPGTPSFGDLFDDPDAPDTPDAPVTSGAGLVAGFESTDEADDPADEAAPSPYDSVMIAPLGAAMAADRLDVPHRRHRDGVLLGLL